MSARLHTEVAPGYYVDAYSNPDGTVHVTTCVPNEPALVCANATWELVDRSIQYAYRRASDPPESGHPMTGLAFAALFTVATSGAFWAGWLLCR